MTLVDTSIWIDLLRHGGGRAVAPGREREMLTCSPVIQEVLQGVRSDAIETELRGELLAFVRVDDPVPLERHLHAADIYRSARRRGLTLRSSVDCLIAAIAIHARVPVWHKDRDFDTIARYTELRTLRRLP